MLWLKKTDYYGQLVLMLLMILSVPVLYLFGFLSGLFLLGCWQLISAGFNTPCFIHSGFKKQITRYWICCAADLILIFLCWPLSRLFNSDDVQVVFWMGIAGAAATGFYYIIIYQRLIENQTLRNELSGFTKSKL
jgi:TRAP-type uncharacterized transport system fused permease subunit